MAQKGFVLEQNKHHYHSIINFTAYLYFVDNSYIDHLSIQWQGKLNVFSSILGLLKPIDLSSNNLTGQIPNEVTNLHGLLVLDLSKNSLVGEIPRNIGHMTELLTLNLSRNMFSREMPSSMSDMHSLNDLDVSFNNLSGRVPTSTQLQSFERTRFTGIVGLRGLPTTKKCLGDEYLGVPHVVKSESEGYSTDETQRWFYLGGATGFATGFCIIVIRFSKTYGQHWKGEKKLCGIRDQGSSLGSSHSRWCSSGPGELPELFLVGWTMAGAKRHPGSGCSRQSTPFVELDIVNNDGIFQGTRGTMTVNRKHRWLPRLCSDGAVSTNNARCDKEVDRIKKQFDDYTAFFLRVGYLGM
ncbi:leucine-rich repeat domain, L domain-like protein [Tanacetum coccineum]